MAKKVCYNGGTQYHKHCSKPTNLVVGKEYEVIKEIKSPFQTNYILKGIEGEFNSVWFTEGNPHIFMVVSKQVPTLEKYLECQKMVLDNEGQPCWQKTTTSRVKSVEYLGNSVYQVKTKSGSTYIVFVATEM